MPEKIPKTIKQKISYWLFPETSEKIDGEINRNNIKSINYLSLAVAVIQMISLTVFVLINLGKPYSSKSFTSAFHVFLSVIICLVIFVITSAIRRRKKPWMKNNQVINVLIVVMMTMIILWSEYVSVKHYISNCQMMTFFTAELCVALFLKLRPIINISIITVSSICFYIYLSVYVEGAPINPYNYAMFFAVLIVSAVSSYRYSVNHIKQRDRINQFNKTLEIIANHDITTRLRNRYSLGHKLVDFIDKEVCIAMVDINKFKTINDTHGHLFGDAVLKLVADKTLEVFKGDTVFRYGGDEFLVVEEGISLEDFEEKFRTLNKNLENSLINGTDITIACSYGCIKALVKEPKDFPELVSVADDKLYEAKHLIS